MRRTSRLALLLATLGAAAFLLARGGTAAPAQPAAPSAPHPAPGPLYSPFVVQVESAAPFGAISFKDVGMSLPPEDRQLVYEALAAGLAEALSSHAEGPMSSSVSHEPTMADPASHLACAGQHVYVDVWQSGASGAYGYSLWSGCEADSEFAHRELPAAGGDAVASMMPLARDIADALQRAVANDCFDRYC